jgi:hypothetical protein
MALMALFGAQTGMISSITNDILVDQFVKSSPNYHNQVECGSYEENDLPPECKVGYSKNPTALTYGSIVKEAFSIIGGLLTSQLTPMLSSRLLTIASIVVMTFGPKSLLWILNNKNISPYLFITANSAVRLIKIIPIIFANLSKIDSDEERSSAFTMTIAALEASSIFTPMTPFFMGKHLALKLAIAIGATTIIVALATYLKEPERPANEEPSTTPKWKS